MAITSVENIHFFTTETALSFYFLGCLMSDGNVQRYGENYRLKLDSKDKDWLEDFRDVFFPNSNVNKSSKQELYTITKRSRYIGRWLEDHGCYPNKSLTLRWPKLLPEQYVRDFLRGYIDGDGSIILSHSKGNPWGRVSVCSGSELFINDLIQKCCKLGFHFKKIKKWKKKSAFHPTGAFVYYAEINNSSCKHVLNWLYYHPDLLCMPRKKKKADAILQRYQRTNSPGEWEELRLKAISMSETGHSKEIISAELGVSVPYLKLHLKGIQPKPTITKISLEKNSRAEQVRRLHQAGQSTSEIIGQTGFSRSAICNYLKGYSTNTTNEEKVRKIKELRATGLTLKKIIVQTGYSKGFIIKHIKGTSYNSELRTKMTPELMNQLNEYFQKGMNNTKIMNLTGLKSTSVKNYRRRFKEDNQTG